MRTYVSIFVSTASLVLAASLGACSDDDTSTPVGVSDGGASDGNVLSDATTGDAGSDGAASDGTVATLSDGQVVAVLEAANTGEIQQANVVLGPPAKSTTAAVVSFATMMVTDHTAANAEVQALNIPADTSASDAVTLMASAQAELAKLGTLSGTALDDEYIASQVTTHQTVLGLIDAKLIPSAQAPALKSLLNDTRATVQRHLQMAQQLAVQLGIDAGSADAGVSDAAAMDGMIGDAATDATSMDASTD